MDSSLHLPLTMGRLSNELAETKHARCLQGDLNERVALLLEQRKTAYDFADIKIDTSNLTIEQIIATILTQRKEAVD